MLNRMYLSQVSTVPLLVIMYILMFYITVILLISGSLFFSDNHHYLQWENGGEKVVRGFKSTLLAVLSQSVPFQYWLTSLWNECRFANADILKALKSNVVEILLL